MGQISCHAGYKAKQIVAGSDFRTLNGMALASDGRVLVMSAVGESLFVFDRSNGRVETVVGLPLGASDDGVVTERRRRLAHVAIAS